jgi:SPP1 gp7 family putative phage head morphogenesis protein
MERSGDEDLRKIAIANLDAWKQSGVVKAFRYFSAEDEGVCPACKARLGAIVKITDGSIGANLPPLDACVNDRCRCYFRPWYVSMQ